MPIAQVSEANGSPLNERISHVGRELTHSLHEILLRAECQSLAAPHVARTFKTNQVFAHRLTKALRRDDPLAAMHEIPGPEPLRRLVTAASKQGVPRKVLRAAESAIAAFESLIRNECGDRSGLDAILSTWLPDARSQIESSGKQLAYRGMRQILGIAAERVFSTVLVHPSSANPERVDSVVLQGYMGLRCIRPGAKLKLGMHVHSTSAATTRTLEGTHANDSNDTLLREFCSNTCPMIEIHKVGKDTCYLMDWGDSVGIGSSENVVVCEVLRESMRRHQRPEDPRPFCSLNEDMDVPAQSSTFDVLVHRDLYPNANPELRTIRNGLMGIALPNDGSRDFDVIDVRETVELLGSDLEHFEMEGVTRYAEMLQHVCEKLRWSTAVFRGYRCQVEYPIFGSQLQMRFEVPIDNIAEPHS